MKIKQLKIFKSNIGKRDINFKDGINFLVGENGVGKSTILNMLNQNEKDASYMIVYEGTINLKTRVLSYNRMMVDDWAGIPTNISWNGDGWEKGSSFSIGGLDNFEMGEFTGEIVYIYSKNIIESLHLRKNGNYSQALSITNYSIFIDDEASLYGAMFKEIYNKVQNNVNNIFLDYKSADRQSKEKSIFENKSEILELLNTKINLDLSKNIKSISSLDFSELPLDDHYDSDHNRVKSIIRFVDNYNNKNKIENLSSGQRRSIATSISLGSLENILLFDEPSNFLSSDMKRRFAYELSESKTQIIIATHDYDLVHYLYKILPNIILMKTDKAITIDLAGIKEEHGEFFDISNNAIKISKVLFAKKALIVEGPDDVRLIMHNKELSDLLNKKNIELIYAQGFNNLIKLSKFLGDNGIDYISFADNDVKINYDDSLNIVKTDKTKIEDYLLPEITATLEQSKDSKRLKQEVRKMYSEGKLMYEKSLFDEIWSAISDEEVPDKYNFTWI